MATKVVMSDALKVSSIKAIHAYSKAWERQKTGAEKLSIHLLNLSKECEREAGGDLAKAAGLFDAAAKYAQQAFQDENLRDGERVPIAELLPYWPVVKSEILRALRKGVKPSDAESVVDMMRERKEKDAEARESEEGGSKRERKGKPIQVSQTTAEAFETLTATVIRVDGHQHLRPQLADLIRKATDAIGALIGSESDDLGTEDTAEAA